MPSYLLRFTEDVIDPLSQSKLKWLEPKLSDSYSNVLYAIHAIPFSENRSSNEEKSKEGILLKFDFGSKFIHLVGQVLFQKTVNIEKRLIIANVYREIHPGTFSFCKLVKLNPKETGKIIFSFYLKPINLYRQISTFPQ